jgi:hypothetical protein
MRRLFVLPAMVTLLATVACAGPSVEPDAATTSPSRTSEDARPTVTAAATTTELESAVLGGDWSVPFTMTAPGWERRAVTTTTTLWISSEPDAEVAFTRQGPDTVDAWIQQLTSTPQLVLTEPEAVDLGGALGYVLDVSLGPEGGEVTLFADQADNQWAVSVGRPNRVWIVDVDGETVMIATDAPEEDFESWAQTAEAALSTIEWGP